MGEYTISRGELSKINVERCKQCGRVNITDYNADRLAIEPGWYPISELQQKSPGDGGLDVVIRPRGGFLGKKVCPDCKSIN